MADADLARAGEALYTARAAYMIAEDQGLTATYNQLKDAAITTEPIQRLRALHDALDRAVIRAYGWYQHGPDGQPLRDPDGNPIPLDVPPYGTATPQAQAAFDDEVIDRLFLLNAQRAQEEATTARQQAEAHARQAPPTGGRGRGKKKKPGGTGNDDDGQLGLL
ncbi:MAG: hypothetical protein R3F60_30605 [bacterium]